MKYKVGDRVKFLNEVGGGVVCEIIGPSLVRVTTTDGFDIPFSTRDIIAVEEDSVSKKMFNSDMESIKDIQVETPKLESVASPSYDYKSELILTNLQKQRENQAIWLLFVPIEQTWLITGGIEVYLVNYSDMSLYAALYYQNNGKNQKIVSKEYKPFSKNFIGEINRDEIALWENLVLQGVFVPDSNSPLLMPVDVEIKVRGSKFYKESSYQNLDFIREKAIAYRCLKMQQMEFVHNGFVPKDLKKEDQNIKVKNPKRNDIILQYQTTEGEAVVDIHIWKLTPNEERMSKHEKLLMQLDYFQDCLNSAIELHFSKVVFIHGVGSGRLREEIIEILDEKEIEHKAASMAEYGLGAIQVMIPQNYIL